MGLGGRKGTVTPHEQNPSPRPKGPKMSKRKMKRKNKREMEELKKEVVMIRTPEMGADKLPSKNLSQPSGF